MSRHALIKGVWPDKALYGSVMLFVTALVGLVWALVEKAIGVEFGARVPTLLHPYGDPLVPAVLSLLAAALAYVALRRRESGWSIAGAVVGVLGVGMLGLGSILSLLALVFLVLSRAEGEHESVHTAGLTAEMWPDKSLAASMTILVTGVVTLVWGVLILGSVLEVSALDELGISVAFGAACVLVAGVCFAAARTLYHQRSAWLGLVAGIGGVLAFGLYVIGPLLSVASLVLLWQAWREDEFH